MLKTCPVCSKTFPKNGKQKYCTNDCSMRAFQRKRKSKRAEAHFPGQKEMRCKGCDVLIPKEQWRPHKFYCSTRCRVHWQYRGLNPLTHLSTGTMGALSEIAVCADLMHRGYEVFRALSPACSCDIAILRNGELHRVEVKTQRYNTAGNLNWDCAKQQAGKHDVLALYIPTTREVVYRGLPDTAIALARQAEAQP